MEIFSTKRNLEKLKKQVNYHLRERSSGKFNIQKNANVTKILSLNMTPEIFLPLKFLFATKNNTQGGGKHREAMHFK